MVKIMIKPKIYWSTILPLLKEILINLMNEPIFDNFRLVGGTALSLQIGHRISVDIDLFSDAEYGSINFENIENFLHQKYKYFRKSGIDIIGFGTSYFVGNNKDDSIKIDLYYTDDFVFDPIVFDNIRIASEKEIIAMKLDVILRNGRKKDFWDLHYYLEKYSIKEMISFFRMRYPYNDDFKKIENQLLNFDNADSDFEPNCLMGKTWELIKFDFYEKMKGNS